MTGIQRLGAFLRSPHHAWLGLLTLGVGLATANVAGMIIAAAAYALGWIFLPDTPWFRRWLQRRLDADGSAASEATAAQFARQRAEIHDQLSAEARRDYDSLARAIEEIRVGSGGGESPHAGRLGQLAWTCLRLLLTRQTLSDFCARESSAAVGEEITAATAEIESLETQARAARESGDAAGAGSLERLLQSRRSRLESLRQRGEHVRKAEADLALTHAEIDRIHDAVRLIQADLVTRRDPDSMGEEIDRTTAHFHRTRDWLRDLEFDHTPADIPDELTAVVPIRIPE